MPKSALLTFKMLCSNAIPEPAVGDYATDAQFSTADRPGGSSEIAQGTPLLPQPGSALAPAPAPMPGPYFLDSAIHGIRNCPCAQALLMSLLVLSDGLILPCCLGTGLTNYLCQICAVPKALHMLFSLVLSDAG